MNIHVCKACSNKGLIYAVARAGISGFVGIISGGATWVQQDREREDAPESSHSPGNPYDVYVSFVATGILCN